MLESGGFRLGVIGLTDHPEEYAARPDRPGVAYADLRRGLPDWLARGRSRTVEADAVLVSPHWGPNMTAEPLAPDQASRRRARSRQVRRWSRVTPRTSSTASSAGVIYDLGDFIDDYATDPVLRNDLGLLFLVTLEEQGPVRLEALPLKLDYCHTRAADGEDAAWIARRFRDACARLGTDVGEEDGRLVVTWEGSPAGTGVGRRAGEAGTED